MSSLREECGVMGVFRQSPGPVAEQCYLGLCALQHRGQESCGIAVNEDGLFRLHQDAGLVSEVMTPGILGALGTGSMALGHVRYGTAQERGRTNMQPVVIEHRKGRMALANNGSLTNYNKLREEFENSGFIFHSTSDAEIIACAITRARLKAGSIEEAVAEAMGLFEGSYSFVLMSPQKMVAARGPGGFRPLCYGRRPDGTLVIASESCALQTLGAELVRDIRPGEILILDRQGARSDFRRCGLQTPSVCVFEFIYFARPDSEVDGVSVHQARARAGMFLAREHPVEADIVVGVPDSGIDGAIGYAKASGIPYGMGFIKNKYIGRTFINPDKGRKSSVHIKLSPLSAVVRGQRVVLVDDSIVRGTTSRLIVRMLREAGAREVHMRVTAPPFIHTCPYGTDISSRESLIACRYTHDEITKQIGADSLGFLSLEHVRRIAAPIPDTHFCTGCFTGIYPTSVPENPERARFGERLIRLEEKA